MKNSLSLVVFHLVVLGTFSSVGADGLVMLSKMAR